MRGGPLLDGSPAASRWPSGMLAAAALSVLAVGCGGTTTSATPPAAESVPPTSQAPLVWKTENADVDGTVIAVSCQGEGLKTVVFVSNLAEDGVTAWQSSKVPETIAAGARVCTYDRPGLGASAPSTKPRTVETQVTELTALIEKGAIPAPVVLVAHGYGTFIARQYAHGHVRDVAGLVLVDPPLEKFDLAVPAAASPGQRAEYDTLPDVNTNLGAFGAGKLPPPPSPTIVLAAGDAAALPPTVPVGGPAAPATRPLAPAEEGPARRAGQQQLARKSPFGSFRAVESSGSYLQFWNPDAVIDAIRTVLADARGNP